MARFFDPVVYAKDLHKPSRTNQARASMLRSPRLASPEGSSLPDGVVGGLGRLGRPPTSLVRCGAVRRVPASESSFEYCSDENYWLRVTFVDFELFFASELSSQSEEWHFEKVIRGCGDSERANHVDWEDEKRDVIRPE